MTRKELARAMHAAYRRAYMAQVPGMPCPAWDEMPVTHGPRVAVAVQAGWLAAAREAIARPGGGQEAGDLAAQANSAEAWREDAEELRGIIAEIRGEFRPCSPSVTSWSMEARVSEARWREWGERSGLGDDAEDARAGLGDGHG